MKIRTKAIKGLLCMFYCIHASIVVVDAETNNPALDALTLASFNVIKDQLHRIDDQVLERLKSLTTNPMLIAMFNMCLEFRMACNIQEIINTARFEITSDRITGPVLFPDIHKMDLDDPDFIESFGEMHQTLILCQGVFIQTMHVLDKLCNLVHKLMLLEMPKIDIHEYVLCIAAERQKSFEEQVQMKQGILPDNTPATIEYMNRLCEIVKMLKQVVFNFYINTYDHEIYIAKQKFTKANRNGTGVILSPEEISQLQKRQELFSNFNFESLQDRCLYSLFVASQAFINIYEANVAILISIQQFEIMKQEICRRSLSDTQKDELKEHSAKLTNKKEELIGLDAKFKEDSRILISQRCNQRIQETFLQQARTLKIIITLLETCHVG